MAGYTSRHFFTTEYLSGLPPSTCVDYGLDSSFYLMLGKQSPDTEKMESLFRFYKNLIVTCGWTQQHFYEYLRDSTEDKKCTLRETLNENGFDWVVLSTESF